MSWFATERPTRTVPPNNSRISERRRILFRPLSVYGMRKGGDPDERPRKSLEFLVVGPASSPDDPLLSRDEGEETVRDLRFPVLGRRFSRHPPNGFRDRDPRQTIRPRRDRSGRVRGEETVDRPRTGSVILFAPSRNDEEADGIPTGGRFARWNR